MKCSAKNEITPRRSPNQSSFQDGHLIWTIGLGRETWELTLGRVAMAPEKFQKGDTILRQLRIDVAAFEVPRLQCFIGRGGAHRAVCAARGSGLIGAIECRLLRLFDGSTYPTWLPPIHA